MVLKLTKKEESAFLAAGEPRDEPDYAAALRHLQQMLSPEQDAALSALLEIFGALVRYERRWYFHKGYRAGKKETP